MPCGHCRVSATNVLCAMVQDWETFEGALQQPCEMPFLAFGSAIKKCVQKCTAAEECRNWVMVEICPDILASITLRTTALALLASLLQRNYTTTASTCNDLAITPTMSVLR